MTKDPRRPLPGMPDPAEQQKQKIVAIESTISTTMPGEIGLTSLKQFAAKVIDVIEFVRESSGHCKNKNAVISFLEDAKTPLQLAIDEARPGGNNKRRYQNISLVAKMLRDALKNW